MDAWRKNLILQSKSIREVIQVIDSNLIKIALIIDNDNHLVGTVTDGDVRRAVLKGISISEPVQKIMNAHPVVVKSDESSSTILELMKNKKIRYIPVIDDAGSVIRLETLSEIIQTYEKDNWVVIMAGGYGSRLNNFTSECPKPLLKVGSKPILQTSIENLIEYGFRRFYLSVNYMAEMIKKYFEDGSRWGVEIKYIHENKRMGTAGSLGLIAERFSKPALVINGDIITKINYDQLFDFHYEHHVKATMCVREYKYQVPFGVVKIENYNFVDVEEKPAYHFFVNAGIYILEPDIFGLIPSNSYCDMPDLFKKIKESKFNIATFPIREYWIDIGHTDDFWRANEEFKKV